MSKSTKSEDEVANGVDNIPVINVPDKTVPNLSRMISLFPTPAEQEEYKELKKKQKEKYDGSITVCLLTEEIKDAEGNTSKRIASHQTNIAHVASGGAILPEVFKAVEKYLDEEGRESFPVIPRSNFVFADGLSNVEEEELWEAASHTQGVVRRIYLQNTKKPDDAKKKDNVVFEYSDIKFVLWSSFESMTNTTIGRRLDRLKKLQKNGST